MKTFIHIEVLSQLGMMCVSDKMALCMFRTYEKCNNNCSYYNTDLFFLHEKTAGENTDRNFSPLYVHCLSDKASIKI